MIFKVAQYLGVSALALAAVQGGAGAPDRLQPATDYRRAVADVDSCSAFRDRLGQLPTANALMRTVARTPAAAKTEYESKSDYRERIAAQLGPVVGDTRRVYVSNPVDKYWTTYLPEIGKEAFNFHAWPGLTENRLDLSLAWSSITTGSYIGTTAMGARRRVERRRQVTLTVGVIFPRHVVEDTIYFPLSGSDAAALAGGGGMLHILGELVGASSRRSGGSPTFTNPLETHTTFDEVQLRTRCAFITLNGRVLDVWSFDQWEPS